MSYPITITTFRDALLAYQPEAEHEAAIFTAQGIASPVVQCVEVFRALRSAEGLDNDGLSLLLGAAHLIASGGWHGLASEAVTLISNRAGDLVTPEPEPEPDPA
jgi:hypothetical protein